MLPEDSAVTDAQWKPLEIAQVLRRISGGIGFSHLRTFNKICLLPACGMELSLKNYSKLQCLRN